MRGTLGTRHSKSVAFKAAGVRGSEGAAEPDILKQNASHGGSPARNLVQLSPLRGALRHEATLIPRSLMQPLSRAFCDLFRARNWVLHGIGGPIVFVTAWTVWLGVH